MAEHKLSEDYYLGVKDGIRAHAIWRDGKQYVGALAKPIEDVFAEVDRYAERGDWWSF